MEAATLQIHAKGGGRERLFLNPQLVVLLGQYLAEGATQGACGRNMPVSRSKSGRRLGARQIQLNFAQWLVQAGISFASGGQARPFSVHSLRHTFATRLYRKTGDLYLVQRALGHRQIATTEIYARVDDDAVRRSVGTTFEKSPSNHSPM